MLQVLTIIFWRAAYIQYIPQKTHLSPFVLLKKKKFQAPIACCLSTSFCADKPTQLCGKHIFITDGQQFLISLNPWHLEC